MNIVADQLSSKANTQAMLGCYLMDMKEYFKKSPNFTEDKTYARILKIAETTQKFLPHFNSISNISLKLVGNLKLKVDDKFETNNTQPSSPSALNNSQNGEQNLNDDIESLSHLKIKISKQNDATKTAALSLGRDINQQFMRKLVFDALDDLKDQIEQAEAEVYKQLSQVLNKDSQVLFFDSHLSNKNVITKVTNQKKIKLTFVKTNGADPKNNQINLTDVASRIRKYQKVVISAESILKNGAIIAEPGSLMVALAARKHNIPIVALGRGFCLTQKVLIDQYSLLAENPMKYFPKTEGSMLKAHIAKKFDLIESKFVAQIISELGAVSPPNIELHFSQYYDYN